MSNGARERPLAVVVGGELNGLGVVRSLAREHVPTIVIDTNMRRPTMRTRFAQKRAATALTGQGLIDDLQRLRSTLDHNPVLLLTQEASVATISEHMAQIQAQYRISMPPCDAMRALMDKTWFQAKAEELGFAIPKSIMLVPGDDGHALESLRYPCVLKPATKNPVYIDRFPKAHRLADASVARTLWRTSGEAIGRAVVQEWIEGEDCDVFFCLQYRAPNGEVISFTGRKTCQWPPLVGGTATCMPAPQVDAQLTQTTNSFFEAVGFVGLCSMEYKRDPRDGRFYMVEPTVGRTDYQEEIATLNGVNIPFAAYLGEQGLPIREQARPARATAWRDEYGHHNALRVGGTDALSTIAPEMQVVDAYLRTDDPGPYLAARLAPVAKRLRDLTKPRNATH
jgi:predicted ATP-grasp superfamily ATP-dependent carboligase